MGREACPYYTTPSKLSRGLFCPSRFFSLTAGAGDAKLPLVAGSSPEGSSLKGEDRQWVRHEPPHAAVLLASSVKQLPCSLLFHGSWFAYVVVGVDAVALTFPSHPQCDLLFVGSNFIHAQIQLCFGVS